MTAVVPQRRRDPAATREAILDAAAELFVGRGFAATSLADIARLAAVTKSLIHHHFGSKEELWKEVKSRTTAKWAAAQKDIVAQGAIDRSLFGKSIATFFHFLKDSPGMVRLFAWMSLEEPRLSATVRPELMATGVERIREAQRQGKLRRDVDAEHMLIFLMSSSTHWFMARHWYQSAGLVKPSDQKADQSYLDDLLRVLLDGLGAE